MRPIRWVVGVGFAGLLAAVALYLSPYWTFRFWDRGAPPLGFEVLQPQGDLVDVWTRRTPLDPFDLMVWAVGVFLALSFLQWVWGKIFRG